MASRTGRKVARFSLQDVNTVAVLDLRAQGLALKGFASGFTDGAYGYVVPYSNGAWHGKLARFSLRDFSTVAVLIGLDDHECRIEGFHRRQKTTVQL